MDYSKYIYRRPKGTQTYTKRVERWDELIDVAMGELKSLHPELFGKGKIVTESDFFRSAVWWYCKELMSVPTDELITPKELRQHQIMLEVDDLMAKMSGEKAKVAKFLDSVRLVGEEYLPLMLSRGLELYNELEYEENRIEMRKNGWFKDLKE